MKLTIEQVSFLRDMKGAPASIILALSLTGLSLLQRELELATGYSDKTLSRGLALLELHGLVQRNGRSSGWSLPFNLQLPLFPAASLGRGTRRISDLSLLSSSSDLDPFLVESKEEDEEQPNTENFRVTELLICAGVGRNSVKMKELVRLALDESYVQEWVLYFEWWRKESKLVPGQAIDGRKQFSVGTLIRVLLDQDPAPGLRCSNCLELLPCYCTLIKS